MFVYFNLKKFIKECKICFSKNCISKTTTPTKMKRLYSVEFPESKINNKKLKINISSKDVEYFQTKVKELFKEKNNCDISFIQNKLILKILNQVHEIQHKSNKRYIINYSLEKQLFYHPLMQNKRDIIFKTKESLIFTTFFIIQNWSKKSFDLNFYHHYSKSDGNICFPIVKTDSYLQLMMRGINVECDDFIISNRNIELKLTPKMAFNCMKKWCEKESKSFKIIKELINQNYYLLNENIKSQLTDDIFNEKQINFKETKQCQLECMKIIVLLEKILFANDRLLFKRLHVDRMIAFCDFENHGNCNLFKGKNRLEIHVDFYEHSILDIEDKLFDWNNDCVSDLDKIIMASRNKCVVLNIDECNDSNYLFPILFNKSKNERTSIGLKLIKEKLIKRLENEKQMMFDGKSKTICLGFGVVDDLKHFIILKK